VLAIAGLPSCAPAAAPTTAAPDRPAAVALKPPLDSLAFYVGTWRCKGTWYATSTEPEETWEATMEVEPELDGTWLSVKMIGPGANRTIEHKGYNPTKKRWDHIAVLQEGSWALFTSPGWTGSAMVFTPDDPAEKSTRATFTKLSETSYSHVVTRETDHGVEKVWEKVCTKM
jgi:hypothetical protein